MIFNLLPSFCSTAPGPVPPPGAYMAGGNRSEVPYTFSTISGANNIRQGAIHIQSPAHATIRNPIFAFSAWYAGANGGEASASLNPFNLRAALEYPLGTRYRLYFPAATVTQYMALGEDWECSLDPLVGNLDIPPDSSYWIRTWREYLGPGGIPYGGVSYNMLLNQLLAPGRNECIMSGSDPNVDYTVVGSMTAVVATSQDYGPTMVRALIL